MKAKIFYFNNKLTKLLWTERPLEILELQGSSILEYNTDKDYFPKLNLPKSASLLTIKKPVICLNFTQIKMCLL